MDIPKRSAIFKKSGHKIGIVIIGICFTLFDNYIKPPGIRVFDWLGWAILFLTFFSGWLGVRSLSRLSPVIMLIIMPILLVGMIAGIFLQQSPAVILFSLGLVSYLILSSSYLLKDNLFGIVKLLLLVISLCLILQYILFLSTGELQSFILWGTEKEVRSITGFRPTGLFIEPGSHALAVITLMSIYIAIKGRLDGVVLLSAASIILSRSLGGLGGLFILLLLYGLKTKKNKIIYFISFATLIYLAVLLLPNWELFDLTIIQKIDNIALGTDGSYNDRLDLFTNDSCHVWMANQAILFPIIGSGLSSDAFTSQCGSNNLALLIFSFGYLGALLLIVLIITFLWKQPLCLFAFSYFVFSGQITSNGFFWFWLSMATIVVSDIDYNAHNLKMVILPINNLSVHPLRSSI